MLNVICLKHGIKYNSVYVNNLYNMIQRHLTVPHRFVCFTDDPTGIANGIEIRMLPSAPIQGWWWKPYVFKADHFPEGDINLFFDLDMVIVNNIDHLVNFMPSKFVGLQDVGRVFRPGYKKLGSAVLRWPAGQFSDIWTKLESNFSVVRKYHGDQDWIWALHQSNIQFFPEAWIRSYKWEIRNRAELKGMGKSAVFAEIKNPAIPKDTCVLAFHGAPAVHDVKDPVIVENWR